MKSSGIKPSNVFSHIESHTSMFKLPDIKYEALIGKHEDRFLLIQTHFVLTCFGLTNVTKRTKREVLHVLRPTGALGPVDSVRYDDIQKKYYAEADIAKRENWKLFRRTDKEKEFYKILRSKTKLKADVSVLFGPTSLDLYLHPMGVAAEVDGDVHNSEAKMILDQIKLNICAELGIKMVSFLNDDLKSPAVTSFFSQVNKIPVLNSTKRRKLFLALMLFTILYRDIGYIEATFGISKRRLEELSILGLDKMLLKYPLKERDYDKIKTIFVRF
ncbi:MAG: hypothetical protein K2P81_00610 [Bacteriovoracaceae bacterium]|nr:hypothetical protein [Bacteriovoracaceae bacterium]